MLKDISLQIFSKTGPVRPVIVTHYIKCNFFNAIKRMRYETPGGGDNISISNYYI